MRSWIFAITLMSSASALAADQAPVKVQMKSISFAPKSITIEEGQSVVWENVSYTDHSATSYDDGKTFDTTMVAPKASSKPIVFHKAGHYKYLCKMHGRTMSGEVVVTPGHG